MVDSVVMIVIKATAGWLFNKGKARTLQKLQHSGDVVDQTLCSFIADDLDVIKSELRAARRANLVSSIELYQEGVRSFSFDAERTTAEDSADAGPPEKTMRMNDGTVLARRDESTFYECKVKLDHKTKDRFKEARLRAGDALSNQKLEVMDRITAYYVKVMATLLEDADGDPSRALLFCKDYLEKMNSMEQVRESFEIEIRGSPFKRAAHGNSKRRDIIWSVCHVNRVVFDIAQLVGGEKVFKDLFIWPCIEIGRNSNEREQVDPLRDQRIRNPLLSEGKKDCCVIRSFGQESHKLTLPCGIASNSRGRLLVVDDVTTDVFDSDGKYLHSLNLPTDNTFQYRAVDIDTDRNSNAYLLAARQAHERINKHCYEVFVFDKDGNLHHNFQLRNNSKGRRLAVNRHGDNTEVLVLEGEEGLHAMVEVYDTDGKFICQFGERILQDALDIVGANGGHIYVLDKLHESTKKFIRVFDANRRHYRRFDVAAESLAIAFHGPSEGIVIISTSDSRSFMLSVYCKASQNGNKDRILKLLRSQTLDITGVLLELHATVTAKGRIAVVMAKNTDKGEPQGKVIVY